METIAAMRAHPGASEAIGKLRGLCDEAELATELVAITAGEAPYLS